MVKHHSTAARIIFHVTDQGASLQGLDAIQAVAINTQGSLLTCHQQSETPADPNVKLSSLPQNAPEEFSRLLSGQLGLVNSFIHDIHERPSVQPGAARLRPLPLVLREQVQLNYTEWKQQISLNTSHRLSGFLHSLKFRKRTIEFDFASITENTTRPSWSAPFCYQELMSLCICMLMQLFSQS